MKQLVSILLATLMLLSSTGVAYAQHFCGDYEMLAEITLGEKHLSCGMAMVDSACGDEHAEDHYCCDNEYTKVSTDDDFAKASSSIEFQHVFFSAFISILVFDNFSVGELSETYYKNYYPPPLVEDLPLLYETFLI
jgi:hypothetical protein